MWAIGGLARHTTEDKQAKNIRTGHEFSESVGIIVSVTFQTFDPSMLRTLHQSNGAYFWPIGGLSRHTSDDKKAQNIRTGHEFSESVGIIVSATFQTLDLRMLRILHQSNGAYFWPIGGLARHTSEDKQAQNIRTGHEFSKIDSITVLTTFQTFDLRMLRTLHSCSYFFKLLAPWPPRAREGDWRRDCGLQRQRSERCDSGALEGRAQAKVQGRPCTLLVRGLRALGSPKALISAVLALNLSAFSISSSRQADSELEPSSTFLRSRETYAGACVSRGLRKLVDARALNPAVLT